MKQKIHVNLYNFNWLQVNILLNMGSISNLPSWPYPFLAHIRKTMGSFIKAELHKILLECLELKLILWASKKKISKGKALKVNMIQKSKYYP